MHNAAAVGLVSGLAIVAGSASAQSFVNGTFSTGDLSGWTVVNTPNGVGAPGSVALVDIDGPGPLGASLAATFMVGQVVYSPPDQEGIDMTQSLNLSAGAVYTVDCDWSAQALSTLINGDGGVFSVIVDGVIVGSQAAGRTSATMPAYGHLHASLVAATTGAHNIGISVTRPYLAAGDLSQYVDNVVLGNGGATGACCLGDGNCVVQGAAVCAINGGVYRGDGVACAVAGCPPPPTGACCAASGCAEVPQVQCTVSGGTYHGDNSTCAGAGCPANLVCNSGFERGTFAPCWTQFGDTTFSAVFTGNIDAVLPHNGTYAGFFGPTSSTGGIQQTVYVPAGTMVTVGFWYAALGDSNSFSADLGSTNLVSLTNDTSHPGWTEMVFAVPAPTDNPILAFTFFNPPSYDFLDDVLVTAPLAAPTCYANCDGSTTPPVLNVLDFGCFLNRFAAGSSYANCDGSTTPPVLNVLDFTCFLNKFAAGCS